MNKTVTAFGLAIVAALTLCQSAQAQYSEHRVSRHRIVKCYREFVIGSYNCHTYHNW